MKQTRILILSIVLLLFQDPASGQSQSQPQSPSQGQVPTTLSAAQLAQVAKKGLFYEADSSFSDREKETVELQGHVQVIFKDQHLKCQRAVINFRSKSIDATGEVTMTNLNQMIGGHRVVLDLETATGIIYQGYVQSGPVYFEGLVLLKTGDREFIADNAKYTTCVNCPESWSFTGNKIRAEMGGYAYIQNSVLRVGGFPVFWMPYLLVPLKSDRQSGLLTPDYERSSLGGLTFSESYFWAMSRSQDSTWTLKNYELRGLKGLLNYRFVNAENNQGEFDTGLIQDRVFSNSARVNDFRGSDRSLINRWFFKYDHYFDLPDNSVHRMSLNNASDLQYPSDFPFETRNNGDSSMENRISLSKTDGNIHWVVDSSYFINLLQSNPLSSNTHAVHRLPEITLSSTLAPIAESGFLYSWNVSYVNFARGGFAFDSLNQAAGIRFLQARNRFGQNVAPCNTALWEKSKDCLLYHDSLYDSSKDLIRTGQRLDSRIAIERPFSVGRLDFLPRLSFRESDYLFSVGESASTSRRYLRTDISTRTIFSKVYNLQNSQDRIKHEIQPEISATAIPWISQPNHAFFGSLVSASPYSTQNNISDSDLNSPYGLQFDYDDRTYDRKIMTFAFTNRLIRKTVEKNHADYRQFLSWRIAQSYDFYQAEGNFPRQPYSDISSDIALLLNRLQIYQRLNYYPYETVTNSSTSIRFLNAQNDFLQLGYTLNLSFTPGQLINAQNRVEQYSLTLKKSIPYLDLVGKVVYDVNPSKPDQLINSYGIGTQIRLPGECWYIRTIWYRLPASEENLKMTFDFSFDGQKKPPLSESVIEY